MRSTFLLFSLLFCLLISSRASTVSDSIAIIEHELNVNIEYDTIVEASWSSVKYKVCSDSLLLLHYLTLLHREYAKYPKGYFEKAGIKRIMLTTQLALGEQYRAAIPDPYKNTLYFSIDGMYGVAAPDYYLIHILHHELHHCTEYIIWNDMMYKWNKWSSVNSPFFNYLGAGAMAYDDLSISWYEMSHPRKGFVNLYSTTAEEEDRSEIVALIMSDEERKYLFKYRTKDKILQKKISMILTLLNEFSHSEDCYWMEVIK